LSAVHVPTAHTRARVAAPVPDAVDVAVIGAGLGGLYTAARLARAGRRVAVLDAHYVAGGCATMFGRGAGEERFAFDVGLHYVGDCGPNGRVPKLLADAGVSVDWRPLDPDGFDELVFPDLRFRIPADLELYRDRLLAAFPAEKRGIDRYARLLREVRLLTRADAPKGWRRAWEAATAGRLAAGSMNLTLGAFLDSCTRDPRLRAVIAAQNGGYGMPPGKVSLMLHAGYQAHYFAGAYYPRGGGQVLADGLADGIERAGGTIHLRHAVTGVVVEDGRAAGVTWRGPHGETGLLRAPLVVSNADLKRTVLELLPGEAVPDALREKARTWEMAAAIFLTCVAVRADLGALGMGASNYWQFDDWDFDAMYADIATNPRVYGAYVTSATRKDPGTPGHAPPGVETVELMALAPGDPTAWGVDPAEVASPRYRGTDAYRRIKAATEADLVARLERLFPGSTREILHLESASPVTHSRFTGASDGTGYGLAATPAQFLGNRPGPQGPVPGLYFAGASLRAGHGISGALASGAQAFRAIERDGR
jgi:phytoene dehydrogenase-like protein